MINFIKKNWSIIILATIAFIWVKNNLLSVASLSRNKSTSYEQMAVGDYGGVDSLSMAPSFSSGLNLSRNSAPPSESSDRIIIQDTGLSLQVKDVPKTIEEIEEVTRSFGGFLITSHLSRPEGAANGNISVRIPEEKRKEAMTAFKNMAVKVVSESVNGRDVTDQYVDLEARLEVLYKTKIKYEEILEKAEKVTDLMSVQQQLTSLQSQIDNLKGQQKYYEQSAKLSKITIYLSTDELALPYAPTNEWRPAVIFKEAVRSLLGTIRSIGSLIIWAGVYIPILIPVLLIIRYIKKKRNIV
jgi:hypothetical protein